MLHENMLRHEQSPYLLQHKDNPVHWRTWGDRAFQQAREEKKPLFLSIGYSTCHWCHVMEEECFEDEEIADILNKHFVAVKVDREERPDIDQVYMEVCMALTGHGGWPLTIIMTPGGKPFFAGTYFPKESAAGRMGLRELLLRIHDLWERERPRVFESGEEIVRALSEKQDTGNDPMERDEWKLGYTALSRSFDREWGGFGTRPKFPVASNLIYLLRYSRFEKDRHGKAMVEETLKKMYSGGIFDHVGYGFHRYSTDREWRVPHFEKMLYDQALLIRTLAEAHEITGDRLYREVSCRIIEYLKERMRDSEGGFCSAEDADSEGEEGLFYTWTADELKAVLGVKGYSWMKEGFDIREEGNYREESTGELTGRNIILPRIGTGVLETERWEEVRGMLKNARDRSVPPSLDDKILTDWNGMLVESLAFASGAFGDPELLFLAEDTMAFLMERMVADTDRLLHRYRKGEAGIEGKLDDYAWITRALLELYRQSGKPEYLFQADRFMKSSLELFWSEGGFFYFTPPGQDDLFKRPVALYDGATPAGNSIQAGNLFELGKLLSKNDYLEKASKVLSYVNSRVKEQPAGYSMLLAAATSHVHPFHEIVVSGRWDDPKMDAAMKELRSRYLPNTVIIENRFDSEGKADPDLIKLAPFAENQRPVDERVTFYVCREYACQAPTHDMEKAVGMITGEE